VFFALSREVLLDALDFAGQTLLTRRRVGASGATCWRLGQTGPPLGLGTIWPAVSLTGFT